MDIPTRRKTNTIKTFRDEDIRKNLNGVLLVIEKWIDKSNQKT